MTEKNIGDFIPADQELLDSKESDIAYADIAHELELDANLNREDISTPLGNIIRQVVVVTGVYASDGELENIRNKKIYSFGVARAIVKATELLKDKGYDVLNDKNTLFKVRHTNTQPLLDGLYEDRVQLDASDADESVKGYERYILVLAEKLVMWFSLDEDALAPFIDNNQLANDQPDIKNQMLRMVKLYGRDTGRLRYDLQRSLRMIHRPNVTKNLENYFSATTGSGKLDTDILSPQELNYEVLPAGTKLSELAHHIAGESSDYEKPSVDMERVAVLEGIRQVFGPDRCYFARGKKSGKRMPDETGAMIDGDYIILVMQEHDGAGNVISEDALAISPIARKHAAYFVRQDVSADSWRKVFELNKTQARLRGARHIRFSHSVGRRSYENMVEKVVTLLTCRKDEFWQEFRQNKDGSYELGRRALQH